MRTRLNGTGRKRIERRHAQIELATDVGGHRPRVTARFALAELGLPAAGIIIVEAYRESFVERFAFGTVAQPGPVDIPRLSELTSAKLLFRVKVVEPKSGKLLALASRLGLEAADDHPRNELFRVRTEDLGQEVWRVEIDEADAPALILHKDIAPTPHMWLRRPDVRATVLPAAMRTVLFGLWRRNEDLDDDDDSWAQRWFRFAQALTPTEKPDNLEEAMWNWIDEACKGFAQRHQLMEGFRRTASSPEEP